MLKQQVTGGPNRNSRLVFRRRIRMLARRAQAFTLAWNRFRCAGAFLFRPKIRVGSTRIAAFGALDVRTESPSWLAQIV
jgi:hypothetical protein